MNKKYFILFSFFLLVLIAFFIMKNMNIDNREINKVCFNNHCFDVEIAQTSEKKFQGLMFRENLDLGKGMLFVFEKEAKHSFWMKNTLIPLDIIWINKDKEIVFIAKNVQPCKEEKCESIKPNKEAKYVLEINAGSADKINLELSNEFIFLKY